MSTISLADAIKNIIDEKSFSYRKLAGILDVDHAYLYNIAKGVKAPPKNLEFLQKIAKALDIVPDDLLEYKQVLLLKKISSDNNFIDMAYGLLAAREKDATVTIVDNKAQENIDSADIEIDEASFRVVADGKLLNLTYKEFQLLLYLYKNKGYVLTRDAILREVWGYDYFGGTRTVDVHIRRLRFKLGPKFQDKVETVRNVGYRFKR